jgi:hypothetical protein
MLESQGSAKFENGEVTCFKNKICRAISREAYLAYFLMFLILEFFPQTAFSLWATIYVLGRMERLPV